ncbi:MAG: prepilin-type N-terminal cleavage/methylation domain-containing protein [Patescibacteria group bacterium]
MISAKNGFTLIELLIVVAIIALLILFPILSFANYSKKTRDTERKNDLNTIGAALQQYKDTFGLYPTDLNDLVEEQLLPELPIDPLDGEIADAQSGETFGYAYESEDGSSYTITAPLEDTEDGSYYVVTPIGPRTTDSLPQPGSVIPTTIVFATSTPIPTLSPMIQPVDLTTEEVTRDTINMRAQYCNRGDESTDDTFRFRFTNRTTGVSYNTPSSSPYSVPDPGQCVYSGGVNCSALGMDVCGDAAAIEVEADVFGSIDEVYKDNNVFTEDFPEEYPDLMIASVIRDSINYRVEICNNGLGDSIETFRITLTNEDAGSSYTTPSSSPYSVPDPGTCTYSGGINCSAIGSSCAESITVTAEVDTQSTVTESDETNNTATQTF